MNPLRAHVWLLCSAVMLSACDCEDRVRGWVDGRDEPRKAQPDAGPRISSEPVEVEPNDRPNQATLVQLTQELRPVKGTTADPTDADWFAVSNDVDEEWLVDISVESAADVVLEVDLGDASDLPLRFNAREAGQGETLQTVAVSRTPVRVGVSTKTPAEYTIRFKRRLSGGAIEHEPNDVAPLAHPIELPGEMQGFIDRLDDRDVFAVRSEQDVVAKLQFVGVEGVALIARVFGEPSFATPLASLNIPPGGRASIPNFHLRKVAEDAPPAYYIVVTSASGSSPNAPYRVRAVVEETGPGMTELEPNDGVPMALEVAQVTGLKAMLHGPDDIDRYAWGMWEDMLQGDAGMPIDVGGLTDVGRDLGGELEPDSGADASADVGQDAAAQVDDGADLWAILPQKETPRPVAQLEVVPQDSWVTLGVTWKDDGGDTSATAPRAGEPVKLCARQLPTDRFRFEVRSTEFNAPSEGTVADYVVNLAQPPVENLENEPNASAAEADRLAPGSERVGYLGTTDDVDVWGVVVVPPDAATDKYATARFEAKIAAKQHDIMAELRDQDGGVVAKVDRAGVGMGETVAVDLPRGLYYLHVRTKVGGSCEPYTVVTSP